MEEQSSYTTPRVNNAEVGERRDALEPLLFAAAEKVRAVKTPVYEFFGGKSRIFPDQEENR